MRRKLMHSLGLVLVVGLLAAAAESAAPASALAACGSAACAFSQTNFEGSQLSVGCSNNGQPFSGRSAINNCGNNMMKLFNNGSEVACLNPGGQRPNPGFFTSITVSSPGVRC